MKLKVIQTQERLFSRETTTKELRNELKDNFGITGRRLDNFTLSAMLNLAHFRDALEQYDSLALFSVANFFSLELLQKLVENVAAGAELKPLDFVASVGNAANYYLAREYQIHGSNIFTAASQNGLSKGITLAALELVEQRAEAAVVMHWQETEASRLCQTLLCIQENESAADYQLSELEQHSLNDLKAQFVVQL